MLLYHYVIWVLLLIMVMSQVHQTSGIGPNLTQPITYLYNKLQNHYWQQNQQFRLGIKWQHLKGLYQSRVHFNIMDHRNTYLTELIRTKYFKIDDINMFVTSFVLYGLIEAQQLKTISINQHWFSESLQALSKFRDKNSPYGLPQYVFWPQELVNGTWTAKSVNLLNIINLAPNFPKFMEPILDKLGLGILANIKQLSKYFSIPPDNDDSSVNLALLALMKETNNTHYDFWNSLNFRKMEHYQRTLKYAYRPFVNNFTANPRANEIDPRTYFVLHDFIQKRKQQAQQRGQQPSLILPTTWLINLDQQVKQLITMPFETNNVDASVCANYLFGLASQIISGQVQPTQDLSQMMLDTTDLLVYVVSFELDKRPDLVLVYYPSKYDFYWFIARICNLLRRHPEAPAPLDQVYERLNTLMKTIGTNKIVQQAKKHQNGMFWSEFLGNYAHKNRNDDALFSTALALNALLDTWTTRQASYISYDEFMPANVRQVIQNGINFLNLSIGHHMKESNAFFSGSMKVFNSSFPYFFPANIHFDQKGNNINPNNLTLKQLSFGFKYYMKGVINQTQYQNMLKMKWFGSNVPVNFTSFNEGFGLTFPYWSSQPITEVMMITAMSKYQGAQSSLTQNTPDKSKTV